MVATQTSIQTMAASLVNDGVPALAAFGTVLLLFALSCVLAIAGLYVIIAHYSSVSVTRARTAPLARPRGLTALFGRAIRVTATLGIDKAAWFVPYAAGVGAIVLCCAPLLAVSTEAFLQPSAKGMQWSAHNFGLLAGSNQLVGALVNSIGVAIAVSVISALLGFLLSLVLWDRSMQRWVFVIMGCLLLLPGDSYAISLIQVLKLLGHVGGGWQLVVLAHVLWAVPFATGTLILANRHLGEHVLESALEYGNSPHDVIFRIIGRISSGRIAGVALLAGTLSLNEYIRSSYLGAALLTVSNEVHGRLTTGLLSQNRGIFAAEFVLLFVSVITVVITLTLLQIRRAPGRI